MAVADYRYKFTLVDVGAYGGNSDGGIFQTEIGMCLRNNNLNLPIGIYFINLYVCYLKR